MAAAPVLVGDDTRVAILLELRRHPEGRTQMELARATSRVPSWIHRAVRLLEAVGAVRIDPGSKLVELDRDDPFAVDLTELLERLEAYHRRLRPVLRGARARWGERAYVGGYQAAIRGVQPVDFASSRIDLRVLSPSRDDTSWAKTLTRATPFDVRVEPLARMPTDVREETIDTVPVWVCSPARAIAECLGDRAFPRYGAYLLAGQTLREGAAAPEDVMACLGTGEEGDGGGARQGWVRRERRGRADEGVWPALLAYLAGRKNVPPPGLGRAERREAANARNTLGRRS